MALFAMQSIFMSEAMTLQDAIQDDNQAAFIPNKRDLEQDSALHLSITSISPKAPEVHGTFCNAIYFHVRSHNPAGRHTG